MSEPIIVGISGGVDSSVTALELQKKGYEVECVFMKNWDGDDENCSSEEDYKDALLVCDKLNIPLRSVNFSKEYWDSVFKYFLDEYSSNRTPNPDIICNKEVKFKAFLEYALRLGGAKIATGHYAQIKKENGSYLLLKGKDPEKDQSYFLSLLDQNALSKSIFPIGALQKKEVRKIAENHALINHSKKDSTGICFIGEQKYFKDFLKKYIPEKPGLIKNLDGKICGEHDGLMYYTIGQRKGLGVGGGYGSKELPWFVAEKNVDENILIIAQGHDNPALYNSRLKAKDLHWISGSAPLNNTALHAKIRYRQLDQKCKILSTDKDSYLIEFEQPQFGVTPGQMIVFYDNNICLGGGVIFERK